MLKKWAFIDVNGNIGGGGSGIYDDEQSADGSTMKERIEQLKVKYPDWTYHEEPARDKRQPSADIFHVVDGKLVEWNVKELEQREKKERINTIEEDMLDVKKDIDAATSLELGDKQTEKQARLDKLIVERDALKTEAEII